MPGGRQWQCIVEEAAAEQARLVHFQNLRHHFLKDTQYQHVYNCCKILIEFIILQMLAAYFMWKESVDANAAVNLVRTMRPGAVECKEQFEALLKLHRWLSWGGAAFYRRFFVPDQMCNIL